MNAPDRSADVARIFTAHPPAHWAGLFPSDDERRVYLLETLIPELNKLDPQWGALVKNDRTPPFVPSDIIVWRDTREHWDVLTDTGPAWQADGPIQAAWDWLAVPPAGVVFPPAPDPPPPVADLPAADLGTQMRFHALDREIDGLHDLLEVYRTRMEAINDALDGRLAALETTPPPPKPWWSW